MNITASKKTVYNREDETRRVGPRAQLIANNRHLKNREQMWGRRRNNRLPFPEAGLILKDFTLNELTTGWWKLMKLKLLDIAWWKHWIPRIKRKFLQKLIQKQKISYLQRNKNVLPNFSSLTQNACGQCNILLRTLGGKGCNPGIL